MLMKRVSFSLESELFERLREIVEREKEIRSKVPVKKGVLSKEHYLCEIQEKFVDRDFIRLKLKVIDRKFHGKKFVVKVVKR